MTKLRTVGWCIITSTASLILGITIGLDHASEKFMAIIQLMV